MIKTNCLTSIFSIPSNDHLQKIINHFHDLISLSNICKAIHGIHIPLASFPNKRVTIATSDFFNKEKNYNIVMQSICDANQFFE